MLVDQKNYSQYLKWNSFLLGLIILVSGLLKFVQPFHNWFRAQVSLTRMPPSFFYLGISLELIAGIFFLLPFIRKKLSQSDKYNLWLAASILFAVLMLFGCFISLHRNIPAHTLPLKLKSPAIPLVFFVFSLLNLQLIDKLKRNKS